MTGRGNPCPGQDRGTCHPGLDGGTPSGMEQGGVPPINYLGQVMMGYPTPPPGQVMFGLVTEQAVRLLPQEEFLVNHWIHTFPEQLRLTDSSAYICRLF